MTQHTHTDLATSVICGVTSATMTLFSTIQDLFHSALTALVVGAVSATTSWFMTRHVLPRMEKARNSLVPRRKDDNGNV